jgi:putative Holliday junction resolvase
LEFGAYTEFIRYLALDIGTRRTGVAYGDDETGIPLPLETIKHTSEEELITSIQKLCSERNVDLVLVGLPLLPSGDEGSQSSYVHSMVEKLIELGLKVELIDERYTSPRKGGSDSQKTDPDAAAACAILAVKLG